MNISELIGKTLVSIDQDDRELLFVANTQDTYKMYHEQDCCESVYIEEIIGDLKDLLNSPILRAEERTSEANPKDCSDNTATWTFYELSTIKGSVTIRWMGESNGYYSESVDFIKLET